METIAINKQLGDLVLFNEKTQTVFQVIIPNAPFGVLQEKLKELKQSSIQTDILRLKIFGWRRKLRYKY